VVSFPTSMSYNKQPPMPLTCARQGPRVLEPNNTIASFPNTHPWTHYMSVYLSVAAYFRRLHLHFWLPPYIAQLGSVPAQRLTGPVPVQLPAAVWPERDLSLSNPAIQYPTDQLHPRSACPRLGRATLEESSRGVYGAIAAF
jgi:hypothetical protein